MASDVARLQHNASVLYNDLCSYDGDKVYVDANGDLQVDDRFSFCIQCLPLGDYSRIATDKIAIRTLRKILHGLESGDLDPQRIIKEKRVPLGCSANGQKDFSEFPVFSGRRNSNERWLDHKTFALNISQANRFKTLPKCEIYSDGESTRKDLVHHRVNVLAMQIQLEKEKYQELKKRFSRYELFDFSSDEESGLNWTFTF